MNQMHTYYDELGISKEAPPEVIKAAYKALTQKYHPDKSLKNNEATEKMVAINVAYYTLSDPIRRKKYDRWLLKQEFITKENEKEVDSNRKNRNSAPEANSSSAQSKNWSTKNNNSQDYTNSSHGYSEIDNSLTTFWSLNNRITRSQYAPLIIPIILLLSILREILYQLATGDIVFTNEKFGFLFTVILFLTLAFAVFLIVKRLHDCNLSGWWTLIPFTSIVLLFLKGTDGINRFGLDPKYNNTNNYSSNIKFEDDKSSLLIIIGIFIICILLLKIILSKYS